MQQAGLNGMAYPTVFAYPPAYGSYRHPLEPAQWRQGVQYNTYAHMMAATPGPPLGVVMGNEMDTLHACGCVSFEHILTSPLSYFSQGQTNQQQLIMSA